MNREFYRLNTEEFIKRATKTHGDKYSYKKSTYVNKRTKVKIICPIHGIFEQLPMNHIRGQGCPECGKIIAKNSHSKGKNHRKTKEEFQKDLDVLYNGKYEVIGKYINNKTPIEIFCHNKYKNGKEHGFFISKPNYLICGHGCHRCIKSKLEQEIEIFLIENKIKYEEQKHFDWLGKQRIDYYLSEYNIAIECQGIQHFQPVDFKGKGEEESYREFEITKNNDRVKKELCEKYNVYLLYYANYHYDFPYKVITSKKELLHKILNKNDQK